MLKRVLMTLLLASGLAVASVGVASAAPPPPAACGNCWA